MALDVGKFVALRDKWRLIEAKFCRVCVGRHVANNNMFIQMAYILWCYDIRLGDDQAGKAISIGDDDLIHDGLMTYAASILLISILDLQCLFQSSNPFPMPIRSKVS